MNTSHDKSDESGSNVGTGIRSQTLARPALSSNESMKKASSEEEPEHTVIALTQS